MSGPAFLLLYACLIAAAHCIAFARISAWERRPHLSMKFAEDPYRIAALRGSGEEAIRVAVVSLVDRRLLSEADGALTANPEYRSFARRPLEQAILAAATSTTTAEKIAGDANVICEASAYERELQKAGLIADERDRATRYRIVTPLALSLVLVAIARLLYAITHHHYNIGFLVILMGIAFFTLLAHAWQRLTAHGRASLAQLRRLFRNLQNRTPRPGGANTDAVLLAAVFGLEALPVAGFDYRNRLYPKPASDGGGGSDSGSGGCGGGGCGGGCGGCG